MKPTASDLEWDLLAFACKALDARLRATLRLTWRIEREPAVDWIHDLRVSCRRLRAAIALLHDVPAQPPLGEVDRAARRMARAIAPIREIDATVERLSRAALPRGADRLRNDVTAALLRRRRGLVSAEGERVERRAKTLEKAIVARIPLVREPVEPGAAPCTEAEFRAYLLARIAALEAAARARATQAIGRAGPSAAKASTKDEQRLHEVRIAIRRWGYSAEIGREAIPSAFGARAGLRLKRLKDIGGAAQDYADLGRLVRRELRRIDPKKRPADALAEALDDLREKSTRKLVDALRDFTRGTR